MTASNQVTTFRNPAYGVAAIVTSIKKGFAVTFLDTDAEEIIETRIFPHDMAAQAFAYARKLTQ